MGLAGALARDVSERIRLKGNRYFLGGAVRAIEGSEAHVTATVRGSEWYQVHLTRSGDEILASCGCPFFTDRNEFCKHIWAVILAADAKGYLIGDAPLTQNLYLESAYTDLGDDWDEPAEAGEPGYGWVAPPPRGPKPAPLQPWQRFLQAVQERAVRESVDGGSRYSEGEIVYQLESGEVYEASPLPAVRVQRRVRKKNGAWGKPQPMAVIPAELDHLPESIDRHILSLLLGAGDHYGFGNVPALARASFRVAGPLAERVLPLLAESGRLYFASDEASTARAGQHAGRSETRPSVDASQPLIWDGGPPWIFRLEVRETSEGNLRVDGGFTREEDRLSLSGTDALLGSSFLVTGNTIARFDHGGALPWLLELRRHGATLLPSSAAPVLSEAMARSEIDSAALPEALRYEVVAVPPTPRIKLGRPTRQGHGAREELEAVVEFDYAGTVLPALTAAGGYDAERRRMVRRDRAAEGSAIQRLQGLGFHRPWYFGARDGVLAIPVERFPGAVRHLVEEGWHVEAEGRVFRAALNLQLQVKSGVDWFELHGQVDFGDGRSAPIADLLAALKRGEATVILDDGTRGMVPEEWLQRYARVASFGEATGDHVRFKPTQTALLDALLEVQPLVHVDETFARARAELGNFSGIQPLDPPDGFHGQLREYQREALGWFAFLRRFGFGGCLADDMGLGKTVMVLALLLARRDEREADTPTSIVVVPRSLVFNWMEESARFAPGLKVLDYTGEARALARVEDYDILLTTYGTLRRDAPRLAEHQFDYVILDEAQAIKNPATASAKAARVLRGRHRLALSGTPVENHLGELWSLFEFLNPGFLGSSASFGRAVLPQARGERGDLTLVTRALRPFILRRTKEQVAPELPAKSEQTIHCDLEPPQRRFYDELRSHYRRTLLARMARSGLNRSKMQVLEALLRLRQAASHPGLVDPARAGESSAKFDVLLARLGEIVDEGHKVLVFSQFTSLLALLRVRLDEQGVTYAYLDGRTRDRAERVARFESDPACPLFLISLKAGGLGLNLTAADYVFLLDPWWNPAVEAQAIDRAHRIGQSKAVFAYRLIARDTVEEKIAELQATKRELADAIYADDAGLIRTLRLEDVEWLLS